MKRSRSIKLVLVGGLSVGAIGGCTPSLNRPPPLGAANVYTNNHHAPGAGYYHAPYRAWFNLPYNHFDPGTRLYFHGGVWTPEAHRSITNISEPLAAAAREAESRRTDVPRGGWGTSSRRSYS